MQHLFLRYVLVRFADIRILSVFAAMLAISGVAAPLFWMVPESLLLCH